MKRIPEEYKAREEEIAAQSFYHEMHALRWEDLQAQIAAATPAMVERALSHAGHGDLDDFVALISPAAEPYLERMAAMSRQLTLRRFGRVMSLYVPLYLSNACSNSCIYCGYSHQNKLLRKTLTEQEILDEAQSIKALGFEHILLLTGEAPTEAGFDYLLAAVKLLKEHFPQISIEVQPMDSYEYAALGANGLNSVYVYQETYNEATYPSYHLQGMKRNYRYRLETPDRIGAAGVHRIGLGALLGLEDWRVESLCVARHLRHLQRHYWQSKYSVAFPRLRPHVGLFEPKYTVNERNLLQIITAYRLFDENVEMSLTTRESAFFRNHAFGLGITSMSAGSHTEPGGYAHTNKELEQFEISDGRSPEEVAQFLRTHGYEPVWKDWDQSLQ